MEKDDQNRFIERLLQATIKLSTAAFIRCTQAVFDFAFGLTAITVIFNGDETIGQTVA